MEISRVGSTDCFRLRGRTATLTLDQKTGIQSEDVLISGPGEYEIKGVSIIGIPVPEQKKSTIYRIVMDGVSLVYCSEPSHKFTDQDRELLSGSDVLLISPRVTSETISQLESLIVIPISESGEDLESFLKEIGKEGIQPQAKLNVTKDKLPAETTVVLL